MNIKSERLLTWLDEQEASLSAAQADQVDGSAAFHRFAGALTMLQRIRANLPSMTTGRTPIKEMSTPTKSKLRRHDPSTSFQAALSQTPEKSRALYSVIRSVLDRKPMTDEELIDLFQSKGKPVTPSGVRSRRAELVEAGWLRDSGEKRDTVSGHPSIVWEVVPDAA